MEKLKEIKDMTVEELNTEQNELSVYMDPNRIVVANDSFNWNGLDYWGTKARFDNIVLELKKNKKFKTYGDLQPVGITEEDIIKYHKKYF